MLKALIKTKDPQTGFAVSALESLAMKEAEAARRDALRPREEDAPALSPAEAVAALRKAVEGKLAMLLTRPDNVDLKAVQEVQKCLELVSKLETAHGGGAEKDKPKALSEENLQALRAVLGV
jgi:hypothetical protein